MSKLSDFDLDYSNGVVGENLVDALLGGGKTVEVKTDLKWKDTGNVYIETICWSHRKAEWYPSGLSTSKADFWAFVLQGGVVLVPIEVLKKAVIDYGRPIVCNIEPNPSKGYLLRPVDILTVLRGNS